ncbi:MAG: DUF429 domain-containing protein [Actinomycetota bacterium]
MDDVATVAGVDRWRGGWVIVRESPDGVAIDTAADFTALQVVVADCAVIAIDMPMALPRRGTRRAEVDLRAQLGSAGRSVFISPTRAAIEAADQSEATRINRAHDGPGISAQAWGLAGSIRELRASVPLDRDPTRWFETHPERAFAEMNRGTPFDSKKTARGVGQRLAVLRPVFDIDVLLRDGPPKVPVDDVLDACAAAWSARRTCTGDAILVGPAGRDDQGFPLGVRI